MSAGGVGQSAVYSRIPQSVIDSESSEEELHTTVHPNSVTYRKPVNSSPRFSLHIDNNADMNSYRPLGYDGEIGRSINGSSVMQQHVTTRDDVRIIKPDDDTLQQRLQPMGPVRTFFFGFSIFMCFFTVVLFLWILPCDWSVCPDELQKSGIKSWEKILSRIELKGSISIVPGLDKRGQNLVIMGRCKIVNDSTDNDEKGVECGNSNVDGGLISLVGSNGAIAWWKPLRGLPRDLDCSLVDLNKDGVDDCVVVGDKGLFAAVDPISGALLWDLRWTPDLPVSASDPDPDFPLVLPDLDGDGVGELVAVQNAAPPRLVVVSGRSGTVVGVPFAVPDCVRVHALNLNKYLNVSYLCVDTAGRESSKLISFKELYSTIMNQSSASLKGIKSDRPKQHKSLGRAKQVSGETKRYSYSVGGRRLIVENRGRCPGRCGVAVRVLDERPAPPASPGNGYVVWNYSAEDAYAMVPATLLFNNRTLANGTVVAEPISGFAIKFWQWGGGSGGGGVLHRDESKAESATSSNPLFRGRLRRDAAAHPTSKRSAFTSVHQLKERVVLITFNATDMHTVNASQNEVLQLCVHADAADREAVCQPDLEFQEQSLLIADLDHDRSQELFSYFTTYVSLGSNELAGPWRLQSKLRAIRLEAELPKLYEAVARQ